MKGILKDAAILFVITLIAGFCLGAVHEVTLEPIANAQLAACLLYTSGDRLMHQFFVNIFTCHTNC